MTSKQAVTASPTDTETAYFVISDLHYGKKTATFNPEDFGPRLDRIADRVNALRMRQSGHNFDELVICILGDVNDGTGIYPSQPHHQAISNVERQADELSGLLATFVLRLKAYWKSVRVECIPGNHGRAGKFEHEAANWDMVTYRYLRLKLAASGVEVNWDDEGDPFVRLLEPRGHRFLMYHGHNIKSYGGVPFYGIKNRISSWATTRKLNNLDLVMMGHIHTLSFWRLNNVCVMHTGTMITDDDWALQLGYESSNQWWLFGVSDSHPVTWQYAVDLS